MSDIRDELCRLVMTLQQKGLHAEAKTVLAGVMEIDATRRNLSEALALATDALKLAGATP